MFCAFLLQRTFPCGIILVCVFHIYSSTFYFLGNYDLREINLVVGGRKLGAKTSDPFTCVEPCFTHSLHVKAAKCKEHTLIKLGCVCVYGNGIGSVRAQGYMGDELWTSPAVGLSSMAATSHTKLLSTMEHVVPATNKLFLVCI